jgi:hypothetical protein
MNTTIKTESKPSNLHYSVTALGSGLAPLVERVEQKFFVAPSRETLALALLRRTCRAERLYAVGQVNSLYFDTPNLDQHELSDAGEYAKDKVRIRWYGEECDPHRTDCAPDEAVKVWLELKSRRGFSSTKQRATLEVPAAALSFSSLPRGIVPAATLARTIASFGFMPLGKLCPVVAISYWRYRFVEPESGFRVSIDSHIRSSLIMPGLGRGERGLELPGAIVEVKGPFFEVPRALRPIVEIGTSWTRYSKYSSSLDGHASTSGSVSRLWPSGMLEPCADADARVRAVREEMLSASAEADRAERGAAPVSRLTEEFETE